MKKSGIILAVLLIAAMTSCVQTDFDQPPINIPYVDFESNFTIKDLKASFVPDTLVGCMMIKGDTIIQGIITANDESGNIYKTLYIQDNSGGLQIAIDQSNLYAEFKVGQRIYIKCQGLFMGMYGGVIQLGYPYDGEIGRMPAAMIQGHIYKDSLPGPSPQPAIIDVTGSSDILKGMISTLVQVNGVKFPAADDEANFCDPDVTTNRDLANEADEVIKIDGKNFILRTSNYANFAYDPLPHGTGTMVGILSAYNGQYQVYIRDLNDLIGFDTTNNSIYFENFDQNPPDWISYSLASNKNWGWSSKYFCMLVNGFGGDVASDDWLISPGIDLTGITNPVLEFKTWTSYTDSGITNPLEVFVSTDYTGSGDPTGATWVKLNCTLASSSVETSSGNIDMSMYNQKVYIGYHYKSSGTGSGTSSSWEVTSVKVTGEKTK